MITIDLRDLKDGQSLDLHKVVDPKQGEVQFEDLEFNEPIHFDGKVERFKNTLIITGELTADTEQTCSRCLKKVSVEVTELVKNILQVKKDAVEVDIWDGLREQLILNHPLKFVCSMDCKGLCPTCGTNLNLEQCDCVPIETQSPFQGLKDLLSKKKKKR